MNITIKISVDHQKGVNVSAPRVVGNEDNQSPRSPTPELKWGSPSTSISTETAPSTQSEEHSSVHRGSVADGWEWGWPAHKETESNPDDDKSQTHGTDEHEWKLDFSDGKEDTDEEKDWTSTSPSELNSFKGKVHDLKRLAAEFRATCSRLESIERSEAPDLPECEKCRRYEDRMRNRTGVIVDLNKIRQMVIETLEEEKEKQKIMEW